MLDRASTFADKEIVQLLQQDFVPVAIDQANQRRQKDTEGEFYRKIARQSPRNDFTQTTQGFYVAAPDGELLLYNNNRDPAKVRRLMKDALAEFNARGKVDVQAIEVEQVDARYDMQPPQEGLVVRVQARVLAGYEPTTDPWRQIFQEALSRDNLWITKQEADKIAGGEISEALLQRIARFHLVDNTRGEPLMWKTAEVRSFDLKIDQQQLAGRVSIESLDGERGYEAELKGRIDVQDGKVKRFDMVVLGECWGEGPYTRGAPKGRFPLAISFTLADGSDVADQIPPQGARGWLDGYLNAR